MNEALEKKPGFREKCRSFLALSRSFGQKLPVRIAGWLTLPLFPLFCLFVLDFFNFYAYGKPGGRMDSLTKFWQTRGPAVLFEVLVMLTLMLLLLLLCRKAWIAGAILGAVSLIFAFVNFMKFSLNGDNFMPQDFLMLQNGGELLSFVSGPIPVWFFAALAAIVLYVAAAAILDVELPFSWKLRLPFAALVVFLVSVPFGTPEKAEPILNNTFTLFYEDTALQSSNYYANGFVGAFTLNIFCLQETPPEDYSKETVNEIMDQYHSTGTTGELFDVIVVLNESFVDVRKLPGVTFSENPLSHYDELLTRDNCYGGSMGTTALGGGTVRPEFEILTGLSTDYLHSGTSPWEKVTSPLSSYVSNYKDAGYRTIALHPYLKNFYARDRAYGYVGFDDFYGEEDLKENPDLTLEYKRGYVSDHTTFEAMTHYLDVSEDPTFLFTITMQNHQPFNPISPEEVTVSVSSDRLTPEALSSLVTYTQGVYDADKMLGELADYIDSRERPTILFFFGDHYPTLGANSAVYNQTGLVDTSDGLDTAERAILYTTPFVIYSNRDIQIPIFDSHTDNRISSFNVLNAIALATGFQRTAYMDLLLDFYEAEPVYNVRLLLPSTPELDRFTRYMHLITYDRVCGGNYSKE